MNKLLVSDIIDIKSGEYILNCLKDKLEINVSGKVVMHLINENIKELNINLEENSILNIYKYDERINNNLVINSNQNNNSKFFYNASYISDKNTNLQINNYINGNNNESNINIRNICIDKNSQIIINVYIKENTNNNIALEDLKGINHGGYIHIEPNIVASSNEVVANHLTTIGGVDKESLEYLMSKGLNKDSATDLLLKGFICSNMDNYILEKFGGDKNA